MANQEPKLIYDLQLHESLVIDSTTTNHVSVTQQTVLRVPGGWIYKSHRQNPTGTSETSVFVPMDKEFADKSVKVRSSGTF